MPRTSRLSGARTPAAAACAGAFAWALGAGAAPEEPPHAAPARAAATEPGIRLTAPWLLAQLVPSPELWSGPSGTYFGLRWQVTPVLYSFGINRKLSPWRAFIVEPLTRHAGSIELFGSPEYFPALDVFSRSWMFRGGVRSYFPLLHRGDMMSCSLGGSAVYFRGQVAASYEAGFYTLFGAVGAQVTYTPTAALRSTTLTLSIRYF
ncbi:hypothetical protein SOCE26_107060 [Sorangium cellulosum]|uniref:Secreted protein n=1 Tax=Sorangium cellulosum TaxID=56 RepID=A0A2L0FCA0_SORCE|nr:hypothetical protein [Sorangium cellulosum]AUX49161.1 hypothetical protein SOCE26_107060 [Sorangium cellulosum]